MLTKLTHDQRVRVPLFECEKLQLQHLSSGSWFKAFDFGCCIKHANIPTSPPLLSRVRRDEADKPIIQVSWCLAKATARRFRSGYIHEIERMARLKNHPFIQHMTTGVYLECPCDVHSKEAAPIRALSWLTKPHSLSVNKQTALVVHTRINLHHHDGWTCYGTTTEPKGNTQRSPGNPSNETPLREATHNTR